MKFIFLFLSLVCFSFAMDGKWLDDYDEAIKVAKKEHKSLYILITSETCRWCRKFESTTLEDEAVIDDLTKRYVLVHLDRDYSFLPDFVKVKRVPKHYFVTNDSKEIYSFLGYWDELDFRSFLVDVDKEYIKKRKKGILK
ncbi:MAG: thioredoxin family protein [Epsilonproteobacteria bacterium]|nr:thioredoxin family protein [Campylobacterota bacterium]